MLWFQLRFTRFFLWLFFPTENYLSFPHYTVTWQKNYYRSSENHLFVGLFLIHKQASSCMLWAECTTTWEFILMNRIFSRPTKLTHYHYLPSPIVLGTHSQPTLNENTMEQSLETIMTKGRQSILKFQSHDSAQSHFNTIQGLLLIYKSLPCLPVPNNINNSQIP